VKELKVNIPEEYFQTIEFKQEELFGIAIINKSLVNFEPKEVFSWHCSIMVHFEDLIDNGMPSVSDRAKVEKFEEWLDEEIKGQAEIKPNALFLGRITWNKTRELIWRVYESEKVNKLLKDLIDNNDYNLPFDYRIDPDKKWELAKWHLDNCK